MCFLVLCLLGGVLAVPPAPAAHAQDTTPVYFPQTGQFLRGTFRVYFEQNGGLPFFGLPVTGEYIRASDGVIVQYFERARFELQPDNTVLLGDIGTDYVNARGFRFERQDPLPDTADRRYFPEFGQFLQGRYKQFWDANNGAVRYGGPISPEVGLSVPGSQDRPVQYFERGRLEIAPGGNVEIGLLGDELAPCQQRIPRPRELPPSGPIPEGDSRVCNDPGSAVLARVFPETGLPGFRFGLEAINFASNEEIALWLNRPNGEVVPIPYTGVADGRGNIVIGFETRPDDEPGFWTIVATGLESRRQVVASFRLVR